MDPTKAAGSAMGFIAKPLEAFAGLALTVAVIGGLGVWANVWTEKQAIAFATAPLEAIAHFLLMVIAPFADFGVVIGVIYMLSSLKRGLEIIVCSAIVAGISWHFGGQDWIGPAVGGIGHPGLGR